MSRRILYVIDGLNVGGAEMLLLDLLDAARRRGDETRVAHFSPGPLRERIAARGVAMTRLSTRGLRDPLALVRLVRLIQGWRPDIVHTQLVKSDLLGQVAARLTGTRRVITLHNTDPWRRNRLLSLVYRAATAGADGCIAVSGGVADHVAGHGGYRRERIEVIPNGVDLVRFDPARARPMDLALHGVRPGALVAAVIGRLEPQKDHGNFLAAAAALARHEPRVHFLVVGDGPLRNRIRDRAVDLGLAPGRLALTGIVGDMPALLAAIDILVISSLWEGLPMTLLEAMAMKRAIVSTAVGGVPEVIRHGQNGVLVPASDPEALAGALRRLAGDEAERQRLGENGRSTVRERFGAAAMLERVQAVYDGGAAMARDPGPRATARPGAEHWQQTGSIDRA